MNRNGGYAHFPAVIVTYSFREKWDYAWNGGYALARFGLYKRQVKWNAEQARKRAVEFSAEMAKLEKSWVLLIAGHHACDAFGITPPYRVWYDWYRSALHGPMVAVPIGAPGPQDQKMLTDIAEGRLPRYHEEED